MVDRVNRLNRAFTILFTEGMKSLKPTNPRAENYGEQIKTWQKAFSFSQEVKKYVNDLNNMIVLAKDKNTDKDFKSKSEEFREVLKNSELSKNFRDIMGSVKPDIDTDENYDEKMRIWQKAFRFTEELEKFVETLEEESKSVKDGADKPSQSLEFPIKCKLSLAEGDELNKFAMTGSSSVPVNEVDIGQPKYSHKWPPDKTTLTWKFVNHTSDIELAYWQRSAAAVAFRAISLIIPRKFRFERDENADTDIRIVFTHDVSVFSKPNDLAQAVLYNPLNSPEDNGLIEFNDNFFFTPFGDPLPAYLVDPVHYTKDSKKPDGTPMILGTEPFLQILMHEICHAMGYRHDENSPESMMYPYMKKGYIDGEVNPAAFIWTEDDIKRWEAGYGRRSFDSTMLDRLRTRRLIGRYKEGIPYRLAV